MSVYVRQQLIIDVCKPRSFWPPSAWNPVAYWCFVFFPLSSYEAQWSAWSDSFRNQKEQLHCAIYTIDLFFRPYSMSTRAGFSFVLFYLIVNDCSKRLWNFKNLTPFKTWILSRPPIPLWNCWGKLCKEEEADVELCMQKTTKVWHWAHNNAHFLSACHSHTQQRLNPQWDRMVLGIWHNTK